MDTVAVGLVGAGTIGGGVVKILNEQAGFFSEKLGLPVVLKRIVDLNTAQFESLPVGDAVCSTNSDDVISDDAIQVVIELGGGTTYSRELVLKALQAGKHVVTANKALIAEHGPEIFETAEAHGVSVYFEAAVGGGMPAIKTIREAMVANETLSVKTIINGTCNYILTRMTQDNLPFDEVLKQAQELGFAEADPTLDIGGGDTGHKIAIMASLLFGGYVPFEKIHVEGITHITDQDIAFATDLGYTIKLLGIIKNTAGDTLDVRVHPCMLHSDHILASVVREFNAVLLEGDAVGPILLYGKGAGEMPTASAVVSDIIDVARNISGRMPVRIPMDYYATNREIGLLPMTEIKSRYYLRLTVQDRPNALAPITSSLGSRDISIASVVQHEGHSDKVPVVILTQPTREKNIRDAVAEIEQMDFVTQATQILRIED